MEILHNAFFSESDPHSVSESEDACRMPRSPLCQSAIGRGERKLPELTAFNSTCSITAVRAAGPWTNRRGTTFRQQQRGSRPVSDNDELTLVLGVPVV